MNQIDKALAMQIVNTVKDTCGQDINFINRSGIIFASTDSSRIGAFHEIGYKAALTGTIIEVSSNDSFHGTQKGINLPVYYNQEFLAVIGITGEPNQVRRYAHLAERITNLLIRERELNTINRSRAEKKHFVIDSLIRKASVNMDYLNDCLREFQVCIQSPKRLILIRIIHGSIADDLFLSEQNLPQMLAKLSITLFTFYYPNEYLAVIEDQAFEKNSPILSRFARKYKNSLNIAVGKACSIYQLADSYSSACTAIKQAGLAAEGFVLYDDLTLEIIFSGLSPQEKQEFLKKTIDSLTADETKLLRIYFDENMSLTNTSKRLFVHKNTVQYKLNHIYETCGLNPRRFQDGVLLYLALKL